MSMLKHREPTWRSPTNKSACPKLRCKKPAPRATNNHPERPTLFKVHTQTLQLSQCSGLVGSCTHDQTKHFLHLSRQKRLFLTDDERVVKFGRKNIYVREVQQGEVGTTWVDFFHDKGTSMDGHHSCVQRSTVLPDSGPSDNQYLVTLTQKIGNSFMVLNKDSNKQKLSTTKTKDANSEDANSEDPPSTIQVLGEDLERHLFIMNVEPNGKSLSFQCYKNKTHVLHVSEKCLVANSSIPAASFELRSDAAEPLKSTCFACTSSSS